VDTQRRCPHGARNTIEWTAQRCSRRPRYVRTLGPSSARRETGSGALALMVANDYSNLSGHPSLLKQRLLCNANFDPALTHLSNGNLFLQAFKAVTNSNSCP